MPNETKAEYLEMMLHNCRLEFERLTTGQLSVTITSPSLGEDIDIMIFQNQDMLDEAIATMLKRRPWLDREDIFKEETA